MSLLRLVLSWLVLAALPLQGLAAASMLPCGQAAQMAVSQAMSHDHEGADDHASSAHDGGGLAQHIKAGEQPDGQQGEAAEGDDGHACALCASCCNLVGLSPATTLSLAGHAPVPQPLPGPSRVRTREARAPDKPPRA